MNGLTLRNGSATNGGAVDAASAAGFAAQESVFDANEATEDGGAVRAPTGGAITTITDCTFVDNVAGGTAAPWSPAA